MSYLSDNIEDYNSSESINQSAVEIAECSENHINDQITYKKSKMTFNDTKGSKYISLVAGMISSSAFNSNEEHNDSGTKSSSRSSPSHIPLKLLCEYDTTNRKDLRN